MSRYITTLRYVAEQLSRRPETVKLLILVSDGQPADTGYYGTAAEEDLRGIKQEYTRKKILLAAAAIGDDKPSIERIYGDSFLDITDLNQQAAHLGQATHTGIIWGRQLFAGAPSSYLCSARLILKMSKAPFPFL